MDTNKDMVIDIIGQLSGMAATTAVVVNLAKGIKNPVIRAAARGGGFLLGRRAGKIAAEELRILISEAENNETIQGVVKDVQNLAEKKDETHEEEQEA